MVPTTPHQQPLPYVMFEGLRLHIHRRSEHLDPDGWARYDAPVTPVWHDIARGKGFNIHARIRDRYHLALTCHRCGELSAHKVFALRSAGIRCEHCASQSRRALSQAATLHFIRRDPAHRHYAYFQATCGHVLRRQITFLDRVVAGTTKLRCEACLKQREQTEAKSRGWTLVGPDPQGNKDYRMYRHSCQQRQRIARVNMQHGQCDCAACGESWASKPSYLYLFQIALPEHGLECVKLGYSGRPLKRLRHQLGLPRSAKAKVLRTVPTPTGHQACRWEKAAHARLIRRFPELVIPPQRYAGLINVTSEIYAPTLLPTLQHMLDRVERTRPDP